MKEILKYYIFSIMNINSMHFLYDSPYRKDLEKTNESIKILKKINKEDEEIKNKIRILEEKEKILEEKEKEYEEFARPYMPYGSCKLI